MDLDTKQKDLSKKNILWLARKSMGGRKLRVRFTILAMVFGVGFVVFLISIGYGLQRLVVSQIASMQSLKTADVISENLRDVKIKEENIKSFEKIDNVKKVEPLIALIGRGEFKESSFDVGVFGATTNYLILSDIKPIYGEFYDSNDIDISQEPSDKKETASENKEDEIIFNIKENEWIKVREGPNLKGKVIGYTKKQGDWIVGKEIVGDNYLVKIENYAKASLSKENSDKWLSAKVPLWKKTSSGTLEPMLEGEIQKEVFGYFGKNFIDFSSAKAEVIAETTNKKIDSTENNSEKKLVKLAVVNEAVTSAMGFTNAKDIIGKPISMSVNLPNSESGGLGKEVKLENFKIVAVISGAESPQIYMPIVNLRSFGISEFSQAKVEVNNKGDLPKARKSIEGMGFQTNSVADTVDRVLQVFKWINIGLLILGSVALIIATLGMFNTITVSLLERTREIGIMKAIGMKKVEVMFLFFFEAGLMGFWGGVIGFGSGFILAEILNLLLNLFLISPARRFISIVSIPWYLPIVIILFTIIISLLTALLPARRAAKISPLNAIRYE